MHIIKRLKKIPFRKLLIYLLIFFLGAFLSYGYFTKSKIGFASIQQQEKNTPKAFLSEVYDKIKENYWDQITDAQLIDLFRLASQKESNQAQPMGIQSKVELMKNISGILNGMDEEKKKQFTVNVSQVVLASLNPAGRSGLYTQKEEQQLNNTVQNINPQKDLYKDLGIAKGASDSAVKDAYQKKSEELANNNSPQAKEQLKQIAYAKDVLTQKETKKRYDQAGIEPAISARQIGDILYLKFSKFSPTSLDEFQQSLNPFEGSTLNYLIFDLRGNVGGAIDATAYFLGFFIGKNQYAFDFYHKGEYLPFRTQTDKLPIMKKFKQIVVLVDNNTQSSAEMMVASLKKYNVGIVLGSTTKGWGTVERVFPLDNQFEKANKYSLFLVHSVTLRDDNLPIEGRGVEPNIKIKDPDWQEQLYSYFRNQNLTDAIKSVI